MSWPHPPSAVALALAIVGSGCIEGNELGNIRATETGDLSHGEPPFEAFDAAVEDACGPRTWTLRSDYELSRRPHVQRVTDHGASIVWRREVAEVTLRGASGEVVVLPELDTSALGAKELQWVASFDDLEPSTTYCYELRDEAGPLVEGLGFRTAPPPDGESLRFSVFGDLGKASDDQRAVLEQLKSVASDFVLVTGDVAYDDGRRDELSRYFFDVYEDVLASVPFFPATGNHDYHTLDALPFRESFVLPSDDPFADLERWYSFDWGPLHVVVLDTELVNPIQRSWLEDDLASHDRPWTIVAMHRPPYSSGAHGSDLLVRDLFVPLFEQHGVQLVFAGHDHDYERIETINGVTYLVTGAGGIGTRPVGSSDFTEHSQSVSHFVHAVVDGETTTLWAIDGTGQVFDSVAVTQ